MTNEQSSSEGTSPIDQLPFLRGIEDIAGNLLDHITSDMPPNQ
jgi:hypothetical protein